MHKQGSRYQLTLLGAALLHAKLALCDTSTPKTAEERPTKRRRHREYSDEEDYSDRASAQQALARAQDDLDIANSYVSAGAYPSASNLDASDYYDIQQPGVASQFLQTVMPTTRVRAAHSTMAPSMPSAATLSSASATSSSPTSLSVSVSTLVSSTTAIVSGLVSTTSVSFATSVTAASQSSRTRLGSSSQINASSSTLTTATVTASSTSAAASSPSSFWAVYDSHNKWFPVAVIITIIASLAMLVCIVAVLQCFARMPCFSRKQERPILLPSDEGWADSRSVLRRLSVSSRRSSLLSEKQSASAYGARFAPDHFDEGEGHQRYFEPEASPPFVLQHTNPPPMVPLYSTPVVTRQLAPLYTTSRVGTPMPAFAAEAPYHSGYLSEAFVHCPTSYMDMPPRLPALSYSQGGGQWFDPRYYRSPTPLLHQEAHTMTPYEDEYRLRHSMSQYSWYSSPSLAGIGPPRPSNDAQQCFSRASLNEQMLQSTLLRNAQMAQLGVGGGSVAPSASINERRRWERCST